MTETKFNPMIVTTPFSLGRVPNDQERARIATCGRCAHEHQHPQTCPLCGQEVK